MTHFAIFFDYKPTVEADSILTTLATKCMHNSHLALAIFLYYLSYGMYTKKLCADKPKKIF